MNRKILTALCGLILALGFSAYALADEENGGYNTSTTDTTTIGTDPTTGGEAPGDAQQMQSIQQGTQDLKEHWGGDAQRNATENGN